MPLDDRQILAKVDRLQQRYASTEQRWFDVRAAREGDLDQVFPDMVSDTFSRPIVANFVDTVARDLAEITAPLPSFNCSSATMSSDAARKAADRRSKIANNYVAHSKLEVQMLTAADHYYTYGQAVFYIEPDFEARLPRITAEDPVGGYAEYDRWGRVASYAKRWRADADELIAQFPEYADQINKLAKENRTGSGQIEIVRYCDRNQIALLVRGGHPLTLVDTDNPLGVTPVVIARKAWLDACKPKGQFDDVVWVQVARDMLAKLQLEATEKAVQAPMALPSDVQEITTGPDAILRSATPEKIRRVGLEMSPAGFQHSAMLADEMRTGSRYPGVRGGNTEGANIVTGKGVQALMGGFDSQIKAAQTAFKQAFTDVVGLCFKMDEKLWPGTKKNVRGHNAGTPYDFSYTPSKDINGDHTVDVVYGFATGMDPNRAIVMLLQLRAEKAISRDNFMRQLPLDLNVGEETSKVDVEETREAIKQGIFAYVQAMPAMAQQGMDPADSVQKIAVIVQGLKKGKPIEDVVAAAFAPQPRAAPEAPASEGEATAGPPGLGGAGGTGAVEGLTDQGLMRGVPQGQAGQAPGGRPDLNVMLAGLTGSGNPQMSAFTMRRRRV